MPSSLRSGGLGASILNSATSSAARCGGGSEATSSSGTDESRSESPANDSFTSDSVDEVASTQKPRSCASRTYSRQTVVFPIPGSPSISSPAGYGLSAVKDASIAAISTSRPTTDDDTPTASHGWPKRPSLSRSLHSRPRCQVGLSEVRAYSGARRPSPKAVAPCPHPPSPSCRRISPSRRSPSPCTTTLRFRDASAHLPTAAGPSLDT